MANKNIKRRDVLKSIGGTTIGLSLATGVTTASQNKENPTIEFDDETGVIKIGDEAEITVMSGKDKEEIIEQVKKDNEIQLLITELESRGWEPSWDEGTVRRTKKYDEGKYESLVLPFEKKEDITDPNSHENKGVAISWIGNETFDIDIPVRKSARIIGQDSDDDNAGSFQMTTDKVLTVDDPKDSDRGPLESNESSESDAEINVVGEAQNKKVVERDFQANSDISRQQVDPCDGKFISPDCGGGGGGSKCLIDVCVLEDSFTGSPYSCILGILASTIGLTISCGTAFISGFAAVIACIAAFGGFLALVNACSDTDMESECNMKKAYVDKDWLPEITDDKKDCSDFALTNENAIVVESMDQLGATP